MNIDFHKVPNKEKSRNRRRQAGDFMLSLVVALIVVAIFLGKVFMNYRDTSRNEQNTAFTSSITTIAGALQKNFGQNNMYGSLTTAIAVKSGAFPRNLRDGTADTASNLWGGTLTVVPGTITANNDVANLAATKVPSGQCYDIVSATQSVARRITVGSSTVKAADATLDVAALSTACEAASDVTVTWAIGRSGT
ncbi:type 4 pilus major pilin [Janthinobacterium sp. Ant5-2-1]|uniref:type 4 pilus major pilin n=1 Tax=Janthinobacterium sp. Ant5-2-1 TaxID=1755239 RepID=UPI00071800FE|nr:type 4 pilus major pilin [Janthinobacterium sp. Ant5-2-1]